MKKSILLSFFIIVTTIVSSQVITVKLDTTKYFEHSANFMNPLNWNNYMNSFNEFSQQQFLNPFLIKDTT